MRIWRIGILSGAVVGNPPVCQISVYTTYIIKRNHMPGDKPNRHTIEKAPHRCSGRGTFLLVIPRMYTVQ